MPVTLNNATGSNVGIQNVGETINIGSQSATVGGDNGALVKALLDAILAQARQDLPEPEYLNAEAAFGEASPLRATIDEPDLPVDESLMGQIKSYAPVVKTVLTNYAPAALKSLSVIWPPLGLITTAVEFVLPRD